MNPPASATGALPPPGELAALRQIRESAEALRAQGQVDESYALLLTALQAVLVQNRELEWLVAKLRRERVGRRTERLDFGQLALLCDLLVSQGSAPAVDPATLAAEDAALDHEITQAEAAQHVEVDDTWIGGLQPGIRGSRQLNGRKAALVLVAVERRGPLTGRLRMAVIPDSRAATYKAFLAAHVAPGATLYTDGLTSFGDEAIVGYRHVPKTQPSRTALRGGRPVGLQVYLDEFVFRHNRRRTPMAAFQTLLGLGAGRPPTTARRLWGGQDIAIVGGA